MNWMSVIGAGASGFAAGLAAQDHPGNQPIIPTAMDDWDRAFEEATGALPPFSPLRGDSLRQLQLKAQSDMMFALQSSSRYGVTPRNLSDLAGPHHSTAGSMSGN